MDNTYILDFEPLERINGEIHVPIVGKELYTYHKNTLLFILMKKCPGMTMYNIYSLDKKNIIKLILENTKENESINISEIFLVGSFVPKVYVLQDTKSCNVKGKMKIGFTNCDQESKFLESIKEHHPEYSNLDVIAFFHSFRPKEMIAKLIEGVRGKFIIHENGGKKMLWYDINYETICSRLDNCIGSLI